MVDLAAALSAVSPSITVTRRRSGSTDTIVYPIAVAATPTLGRRVWCEGRRVQGVGCGP
jgi:hypothetical protein